MRNPKYYIVIDKYERRIIINSLNNLRNRLIADGKYTDVVDDVLANAASAPIKKFKIKITEVSIMTKTVFEEMGRTYYEENGYLIPDLILPPNKEKPIGIWGQRHKRYLKEYRKATYITLMTSGNLNSYLVDIDQQAEEMFSRLVKKLVEKEGITEQLKAENQMLWVQKMNVVQKAAIEVINNDLIYS